MLKILIVDDSRIFRGLVEKALAQVEGVYVVGSVYNGKKAIEFLQKNDVDLVTLDLEMDEMDGLETLKQIQILNSERSGKAVGSIMISSHTTRGANTTILALQAGAFDFITKPVSTDVSASIAILKTELGAKIANYKIQPLKKLVGASGPGLGFPNRVISPVASTPSPNAAPVSPVFVPRNSSTVRGKTNAIIIGISTGGPKALNDIITELTANINIPIFIVQHMPKDFTKALADSMDKKSKYTIVEGVQDQFVENGFVYIAPGGRHMVLKKDAATGRVQIKINDLPPEENCRPSVNVMFRSAVQVYGSNLIALIMTGMGTDGTKSLAPIKRAGAYIIVQDEKSSVVWGMPGSALATGLVDEVVPLLQIPSTVNKLVSG